VLFVALTMIHLDDSRYILMVQIGAPMERSFLHVRGNHALEVRSKNLQSGAFGQISPLGHGA